MRVRTLFAVLVLVAVVFIMRSSAQTPAANGTFVAGEIIVKFRPGVNASAKADAHRQGGGTERRKLCAPACSSRPCRAAPRRRQSHAIATIPTCCMRNQFRAQLAGATVARQGRDRARAIITSTNSGRSTIPASKLLHPLP